MSRRHHDKARKEIGDKVYTPDWCAKDLIEHFKPTGVVLEPCRGSGSIYNLMPGEPRWCEIDEGVDFFDFSDRVDWIVSNPPYNQTRAFMKHGFAVSDNVVYLVPARNIFSGYGTVCEMRGWGGMSEIRWYGTGTKLGFPMGNAIAAFHWKRGHEGPTVQSFFQSKEET